MKEKDLEKHLDYLIIDGLIKEAEQDNADFEATMQMMSDAEFAELVNEPAYVDEPTFSDMAPTGDEDDFECGTVSDEPCAIMPDLSSMKPQLSFSVSQEDRIPTIRTKAVVETPESSPIKKPSKMKVLRPWILSALSAIAVILIVLIPSISYMNDRLCDSALYASESFMTASTGGFDVSKASIEKIKEELPRLEARYKECLADGDNPSHYSSDLKESGWDLTIAYLRLHKKGKAVSVLKVLADRYSESEFGRHCQNLLRQLD